MPPVRIKTLTSCALTALAVGCGAEHDLANNPEAFYQPVHTARMAQVQSDQNPFAGTVMYVDPTYTAAV